MGSHALTRIGNTLLKEIDRVGVLSPGVPYERFIIIPIAVVEAMNPPFESRWHTQFGFMVSSEPKGIRFQEILSDIAN